MTTTIRVLDETTANKIAAGEVVERPASVIKELAENAIDAQSTQIEIEIAAGGTSFMRITDNGIGMSAADAVLAVQRHATSKISQVEDLFSIASLGFRGEALPSIAAVSRFSLTTRLHCEHFATFIAIEGGKVTDNREAGANVGTTITVSDLFFNTPARQKFLKSPNAESSHIHDVVTKLALSHPHIAFKLINNQRLVLATPGNGQLRDTLTSLYGQKLESELLPLDYTSPEETIRITGFLGKPTLLKSSRQWQTLIVNNRIIQSRFISKALDNAYHSLLPKSGYPLAVLHIALAPQTIDINVHPQKSEVKFSDEKAMFRAVYHAVTDVLAGQHNPAQLATTIQPDRVPLQTGFASAPAPTILKPHTEQPSLINAQAYASRPLRYEAPTADLSWREQPMPFTTAQTKLAKQDTMLPPLTETAATALSELQDEKASSEAATMFLQPLGQVDDCYIVARSHDELYIIDQHAAHERILYDRMSQHSARIPSQQLLVPLFMEADASEADLMLEHQSVFYQMGFQIDLAGPNTIRISELPADVPPGETEHFLRQILEFLQNLHQPTPAELRHNCLQMASCRAAIKAGETLNMRQMQALLDELCATTLPYTCPHGRPAMIRFHSHDLAKMFKRT